MPKLIEGYADRIEVPPGARDVLKFDTEVRGFGIRKFSDGRSVYFTKYSVYGKWRRVILGEVVRGNLKRMRLQASEIKAAGRAGRDILAERAADRTARQNLKTVSDVMELYLAARKGNLRLRSFKEVERYLRKHWAALHNRDIRSVTKDDVVGIIDTVEHSSGPRSADCARVALSGLFDWAIDQKDKRSSQVFVEVNPVLRIKSRSSNTARERVPSEAELVKVWQAAGGDPYGMIVKLLILTGQRKSEIADLMWSEINLADRQVELPSTRTKNGRPHLIPLSDLAISLLPERREGHDHLFGLRAGSGFSGWSRSKRELDQRIAAAREEAGNNKPMEAWCLHDLRRSFTTHVNERGIAQPHVIEAILNHVSGHKKDVAGTYNRAVYLDERRRALAMWAAHLAKMVAMMPQPAKARGRAQRDEQRRSGAAAQATITRQREAVRKLAETEKALEEFHDRPADVLENDPLERQKWKEAVQARDRALGVAIRRGVLAKNVLAHPQLLALACLGDRGALRKIDKNLESGVKRPLAMRDVVLEARLLEMHTKGFSLEQMRGKLQKPDKPWEKRLLAMDYFKNYTRTGVRSWLRTKASKAAIHAKLKALKPPAAARKLKVVRRSRPC